MPLLEKIIKLIGKAPSENQQFLFGELTDLLCGYTSSLDSARTQIVPLLPVEVRDPYLAEIGKKYLDRNKIEQAAEVANTIENPEIKTKLLEEIKTRARSSILSLFTNFFRR